LSGFRETARGDDFFSNGEEVRMAEIFPFQAYRYNAAMVEPAKVLTQPYDKITPAMAEKYALDLPEDDKTADDFVQCETRPQCGCDTGVSACWLFALASAAAA